MTTKKRNYSKLIGLGALYLLALYFVFTQAIKYFVLSEESYGDYFWPRVSWVLPHVIGGIIALLIGPFQFSNKLRAKYTLLHRRMGYIYLIAILIGTVGGMVLSLTSKVNLTYMMGLFFLSVAWILTSSMAFYFILKRKITQHKEWMIRSYVVTFGFVTFRLGYDILAYYEVATAADRNSLMSWACWAVPLLFAEAFIQYRKTFKRKSKR